MSFRARKAIFLEKPHTLYGCKPGKISTKQTTISTPEKITKPGAGQVSAFEEITSLTPKKGRFWFKSLPLRGNRRLDLHFAVIAALLVLVFRGSSNEGQSGLFAYTLRAYIEETSISLVNVAKSQSQLADINSLYAFGSQNIGQGGQENAIPLATIQENSIVAQNPTSSDYAVQTGFTRNEVVEYTVQPGDLISFIASDYGVSVRSILWANNLRDADMLSVGQKLRIPPISGVIHRVKKGETVASIAKKYGAEEAKVIEFNSLPKNGQLTVDDEIIVPDGEPAAVVVRNTTSGSAKASAKFAHLPDLGDYFIAPTTGYNWGINHGRNGVDIANSCGTNIYAAAEGTAVIADGVGWNGGFGQYIKIAHPNGTETVYAHAKKLLVTPGQSVSKGQLLALMGTTGRSTGCHLHFEVHGARNPLLKYK